MPFTLNSSLIGVDLNTTNATALFTLGTKVNGSNDSAWVYVQASGAMIAGDIVEISSTGTATRATTAGGRTGVLELGAAQNTFADTEYGWVARNGYGMTIAISATIQQGVIYIGTTSGKLTNTSGSTTVAGIVLTNGSATATITTTTGVLNWPRCILANG